jgi:aminoglycoside phosphotransferase (APT) family kinase protein
MSGRPTVSCARRAAARPARSRGPPRRRPRSTCLPGEQGLDATLGACAEVTVQQFPGGHSNLTYLVRGRSATREYVLRRPPVGAQIKTAHDMDREVTILSALAPHLARWRRGRSPCCADPGVLGAPFYLMERRHGVILRKELPAGLAGSIQRRARR